MSNEKQKHDIKSRIEIMEKELLRLRGTDREKASIEYHKFLKSCSKECGLEEPIYLIRA